ncbi:hypothetical protein, variant [Spizellomyces punctatus DAOM BR117]|uniref:G-protein coupled receptors family 1 profile domain-containing protein n=1 Tax=Spizellomyces punctatus (strain DAOM BR117) TaxID=645134 RepID=A0A0L0HU92_SPIPD|nr:hypothetical protein, variant [Spizellomyces punctatus DAOM BR117]KND04926.1 hypothetical protein, variant [Spizellomyces punctatus DAOM BR117]|eukprot:XP_016612965.1 hypothetical protein, variant [Spizellomyces punctatus DAOM BR117]
MPIDVIKPLAPSVLVSKEDYPPSYRANFGHPDDLVEASTKIEPDIFYYALDEYHRLFARLPIRLNGDTFTSATFILDTGASCGIYVNKGLEQLLTEHGRIQDDELGFSYMDIDHLERQVKVKIEQVPENHAQVNIIGLPLLLSVGLSIGIGHPADRHFDQEHAYSDLCLLCLANRNIEPKPVESTTLDPVQPMGDSDYAYTRDIHRRRKKDGRFDEQGCGTPSLTSGLRRKDEDAPNTQPKSVHLGFLLRHLPGSAMELREVDLAASYILEADLISLSAVCAVICTIGVVGNAFVVLLFITNNKLRTVTNALVLNLSVNDLGLSLFSAIILWANVASEKWALGYVGCHINGLINILFCGGSLVGLAIVGYERYLVIVKHTPMTARKALLAVSCAWCYCICLSSFPYWFGDRYVLSSSGIYCGGCTLVLHGLSMALTHARIDECRRLVKPEADCYHLLHSLPDDCLPADEVLCRHVLPHPAYCSRKHTLLGGSGRPSFQ